MTGVLCRSIGWTGLGMVTTLAIVYAVYIMAGIGAALIYGGSVGSALKWFTKDRGFAAGVIAAGFWGQRGAFHARSSPGMREDARVRRGRLLHRNYAGHRVILIVAQFLRHPKAEAAAADAAGGSGHGPTSLHAWRDAAQPAIFRALCQLRDDGHRRPAGDHHGRYDGEVVGHPCHSAGHD